FKTVAGDSDRCSGIPFNVKPNGDWLAVRYNDTENNVALWEFHNGIRRNVKFSDRSKPFPLDRNAWHELKMTVDGASFKAWLDRISLSELFSRSPRMSRFLRFTVERSLEGHAEELKEYLLGVEVFDRKPDYDSRIDPIVRVEARRLRAKLRSYYDTEGRDDEL